MKVEIEFIRSFNFRDKKIFEVRCPLNFMPRTGMKLVCEECTIQIEGIQFERKEQDIWNILISVNPIYCYELLYGKKIFEVM